MKDINRLKEGVLRETHALKSDINGVLMILDPIREILSHEDENVRQKCELVRNAMGHMLYRIKTVESLIDPNLGEDIEEFFTKFGLPKPQKN